MAARKQQATEKTTPTRDKAGDFKRLASKRVPKAIQALRSVGKLASTTSYEYTDEQADKVVETLQAELDKVKEQFASGEVAKDGVTFEV